MAPEGCFISAEAVEGVVGQIGQTQKAAGKLSGRIDGRFDRFRTRAGCGFGSDSVADRRRIMIETGRVSSPKQRIDNFSLDRLNLAGLPEPTQMVGLDFKQAGFHCRGAP